MDTQEIARDHRLRARATHDQAVEAPLPPAPLACRLPRLPPLHNSHRGLRNALAELKGRFNALAKLTNMPPLARCRNATSSDAVISAPSLAGRAFTAIFPLALSTGTASSISGQQHHATLTSLWSRTAAQLPGALFFSIKLFAIDAFANQSSRPLKRNLANTQKAVQHFRNNPVSHHIAKHQNLLNFDMFIRRDGMKSGRHQYDLDPGVTDISKPTQDHPTTGGLQHVAVDSKLGCALRAYCGTASRKSVARITPGTLPGWATYSGRPGTRWLLSRAFGLLWIGFKKWHRAR
jgi:hypothetical protein